MIITFLIIIAAIFWYITGLISGIYMLKWSRVLPNRPLEIKLDDLIVLIFLCGSSGFFMFFVFLCYKYGNKTLFTVK